MGRLTSWLKALFGIKRDKPQTAAAAADATVAVSAAQAAVAVSDEDCRKAVTLDMEDEAEEKRLSVCLSFNVYLSASFAGIADEISGAVQGRAATDEDDSESEFSFVREVEEISDPRSWEDELEGSPGRCTKSGSTGSPKRRKLRDFLRDREEDASTPKDGIKLSETGKRKAKEKAGAEKASSSSAHEAFYRRKRVSKEREKRKSYLPYRRGLLDFFASVNGMRRTFPLNSMVLLGVP